MQHTLRHSLEWSDWEADAARRLNISMLFATLVVAAILSVMRFPTFDMLAPIGELLVNIIDVQRPVEETATRDETMVERENDEPVIEPEPATNAVTNTLPPSGVTLSEQPSITPAEAEQSVEWEKEKADAVQRAVDAMENVFSVNPNFDERRREAAIKFRPSGAPAKTEIWDNVEKDQMGRTILRHGNCYRVIDDPRVVNRWAFENFDQYITYCTYHKYVGHELPWVEDIRDRHAYLRERDDRRNGIFKSDPPQVIVGSE